MTAIFLCEVCESTTAVATTLRAGVQCCDACARWLDWYERQPHNDDTRISLTPAGAAALAEKEGQPR
jgi:hypothetical protein